MTGTKNATAVSTIISYYRYVKDYDPGGLDNYENGFNDDTDYIDASSNTFFCSK
jgi:hypothetical protein